MNNFETFRAVVCRIAAAGDLTTKPQHSPEPWKWEAPKKFDHKGHRDHPAYHWHRVFMGDGSTVAYTPDASTAAVLCESERIRADRDRLREALDAIATALDGERNRFGKLEVDVRAGDGLRHLSLDYQMPGGGRDNIDQAVFVARAALAQSTDTD